ncbi:urokinase plasminogen activator surface receptor-like [Triplophysa dalaica]|uniref:urokinase plasminogen activator surface receptor-like n=1 Tax=Triplophysa dalaica TaxID=1582913 RepID=UPI0024DF45A5|nr:urokinase plasminogen activator surface receptor-like [Triplophysa dalaica]
MGDPSNGPCTDSVNTCQFQCGSMTTTVYGGGFKQSHVTKTCADPYSCITGSMNFGLSKVTINSQCCSTDLCNSNNAPELPRRSPNGKACFTCDVMGDCSKILPCEGDENQCFTLKVELNGRSETQKGCSSQLFCGSYAARANVSRLSGGNDLKCCGGNLCNSAQSMKGFFFPLISVIFLFI